MTEPEIVGVLRIDPTPLNMHAANLISDLYAMLKRLEWVRPSVGGPKQCPSCYAYKQFGFHEEGCELAALLKRVEGDEE